MQVQVRSWRRGGVEGRGQGGEGAGLETTSEAL